MALPDQGLGLRTQGIEAKKEDGALQITSPRNENKKPKSQRASDRTPDPSNERGWTMEKKGQIMGVRQVKRGPGELKFSPFCRKKRAAPTMVGEKETFYKVGVTQGRARGMAVLGLGGQ